MKNLKDSLPAAGQTNQQPIIGSVRELDVSVYRDKTAQGRCVPLLSIWTKDVLNPTGQFSTLDLNLNRIQ